MHKLVVQTDFGLQDGAVNAMYGVAYQVAPELVIADLTHEIEPYNIHDASYRLLQSVTYWPAGTVFVSVVDPGVGSDRRSVVAKLATGQLVLTPDNGMLTYLATYIGIAELRVINEATERLAGSAESHTFHGRDVYMYNAARLASGAISFEELGTPEPKEAIQVFAIEKPSQTAETITGTIDILDIRFGSLWTNIPHTFFKQWQVQYNESLLVSIYYQDTLRYQEEVRFGRSFAQVAEQEPVLYVNSLLNIGLGLNLASFAETYKIGTGTNWKITLKKGEMKNESIKIYSKTHCCNRYRCCGLFRLKTFRHDPDGVPKYRYRHSLSFLGAVRRCLRSDRGWFSRLYRSCSRRFNDLWSMVVLDRRLWDLRGVLWTFDSLDSNPARNLWR